MPDARIDNMASKKIKRVKRAVIDPVQEARGTADKALDRIESEFKTGQLPLKMALGMAFRAGEQFNYRVMGS
jgi:hypothetical protein